MRSIVIAVAGGTGSGKTTVANEILERVGAEHIAYIPHDAYYRDHSHLPPRERDQVNFDHPDSLETELLVEHLDFVVSLDDSSLINLFEARKIVELGIVGLAAQRITEEELAELEAGLSRSRETVDDPAALLQADVSLHKAITRTISKPIT